MKRIAILLSALLLTAALCVPVCALTGENFVLFSETSETTLPTGEHILGDTDGDGAVNLRDTISMLRYLGGDRKAATRDALDANGDGKVDLADALFVLYGMLNGKNGIGTLVPGTN